MAGLTEREVQLALGGAAAGVITGFAAGFFAIKKSMQTKYEKIAQDEIEQMRLHYEAKAIALQEKPKLEEFVGEVGYSPEQNDSLDAHMSPMAEDMAARLNQEFAGYESVTTPAERTAYHNIFERPPVDEELIRHPDWDYAEELKFRERLDEGVPYIIHKDEFDQGELEYERLTLTYFEGDDVLCDERDQVVDDQDAVVGVQNMGRFGHGSGDPNKVFVRNPELQEDIEILRSEGRFAAEVHGFVDEDDE